MHMSDCPRYHRESMPQSTKPSIRREQGCSESNLRAIRMHHRIRLRPQSPSPSAAAPFFLFSSTLVFVFSFAPSIHRSHAPSPSCTFALVTPFINSPMKPMKLCFRRAFSHCHAILFCSSLYTVSSSPTSRARILRSWTIASRLNRIS